MAGNSGRKRRRRMTDIFKANGAQFIAANDVIVQLIRRTGQKFEPDTTAWVTDRLDSAAGLFLDIGAGTGWFSILAANMGARVIAVDANPRVQKRLAENIELNGADIETVFAAATDKPGPVIFTYNPRVPLTSGGSLERDVRPNTASEAVIGRTADSIVGSRDVAVMKIDVEGHELRVLAGAVKLIARSRPFIVMEANTPKHVSDLGQWCAENGYSYETADDRNMLCSPKS